MCRCQPEAPALTDGQAPWAGEGAGVVGAGLAPGEVLQQAAAVGTLTARHTKTGDEACNGRAKEPLNSPPCPKPASGAAQAQALARADRDSQDQRGGRA